MAINNVTVGTFKGDCKVINLAIEYPGYTGKEKYAIITDLSRDELEAQYKDITEKYEPFLILTREMGLVIKQFQSNEKKHEQRSKRNEHIFDSTDDRDSLLVVLSVGDAQARIEAEITRQEFIEATRYALNTLTPLQCQYLKAHYLENKSYQRISEETGKRLGTVWRICNRGRKDFIKAVKAMGVAA